MANAIYYIGCYKEDVMFLGKFRPFTSMYLGTGGGNRTSVINHITWGMRMLPLTPAGLIKFPAVDLHPKFCDCV